MVDPRLEQYINAKRLSGATDEMIRIELIANKWDSGIVNESLGMAPSSSIPTPTPDHYYGIGELIGNSIHLFKEKFVGSFLILLFPSIVGFLVSFLFGTIYALYKGGLMTSILNGANGVVMAILMVVGMLIGVIAIMVIQFWSSLALLYTMLSTEKIHFTQSFKNTWSKVRSFWWLGALEMLVVMGGFTLLIIPGLVVGVWFTFSQFVLIDGDTKGMNALLTSREYVRGYGWSIFGRLILFILTLGIVGGIFEAITKALGLEKNIVIALLTAIANIVLSLFTLSLITVMYKNIKSVKGNVDTTGKSKVGFVILAVIGVLGILLIPIAMLLAIDPSKQINNARATKSLSNQMEVRNAVLMYYAEKSTWPTSLNDLVPTQLREVPQNPNVKLCYKVSVAKEKMEVSVTEVKKTSAACDPLIVVN